MSVEDQVSLMRTIIEYNNKNEPVTFTKLKKEHCLDQHQLLTWLTSLEDWGLVEHHYGPLGNGKAGLLWYATSQGRSNFETKTFPAKERSNKK